MNDVINMEDVNSINIIFSKYVNELHVLFNNLLDVLNNSDDDFFDDKSLIIKEIKELMLIDNDICKVLGNKVLSNYNELDDNLVGLFDLLDSVVIPNYELLSQSLVESFNKDFVNKLSSLLEFKKENKYSLFL